MNEGLSRRAALRGLGVCMALPWLEAMTGRGSRAQAAVDTPPAPTPDAVSGTPPVRLAFIFMPNGVNYEAWEPTGGGGEFALSPTLAPLAPVRSHVSVITGLTNKRARANGDGPGDHARSSAAFLTGCQPRKTAGNDIHNGISVDQFAAAQLGHRTRLPSLELGCEHAPRAGNCDSGYSCAYTSNIAWRDAATPVPKVVDPADAFERLFGDATQAAAAKQRLSRRQSILDFVLEDSRTLSDRLGNADRRKLDQFQTSVREIEQRIERARAENTPRKVPDVPPPAGIPEKVGEHMDLMFDMLLLAFQTDTTRISTLMLAGDGSNRVFPEIGVKDGHHHLSHHQNDADMIEKIRRIDRFHVERFARFIQHLAETKEGEGSVLDNSLIVFGGGISDGNRHNHENLPILLAGRGGGTVEAGRLLRTPKETPLCNLYLSMLDKAGCPADSFADSTERLAI
ncbi:MAG TPA: DUF1552 domain-containing protein [Phycisphaerales bacterium]|nr:DUF1552 domain-containing protein [Phycisphaerales bacterium]